MSKNLYTKLAWPTSGNAQIYTSKLGGMAPNDTLTVEFKTPSSLSVAASSLFRWGREGSDPQPMRKVVLTADRNDFTIGFPNYPKSILTGKTGAMIWFTEGGTDTRYPILKPGKVYYLNIMSVVIVPGPTVNLYIEFAPPR